MTLAEVAPQIAELARLCYARGWAPGTSGNFSATVSRDPLRLAITASGVDKGTLTADDIVEIDGLGRVVAGSGRPSAESSLHLAVVRARGAGAVLHTHSIWSTIISEAGDHGAGHRRVRDAEGSGGRGDPRAPRVAADPREHPGLGRCGAGGGSVFWPSTRRRTDS